MKRRRFLILIAALGVSAAAALAACAAPTPIPPTPTPTASPTLAAQTATSTALPTPTAVPTNTPTDVPTATPEPTKTPTEAPTKTPTPTATPAWYESTDMEVRRREVEAWVNNLSWEGYSTTDIAELKNALIKYLPYIHTSPLTVFPWYSRFPEYPVYKFPENPLAYLEYVRTISNWDGKVTANEPNIQAVRLDRTEFQGRTDEPEVESVAAVMKEAMFNAVSGSARRAVAVEKAAHNRQDTPTAIFLSGFYRNNLDRHDWGTHSMEIIVRQDLLNAVSNNAPVLRLPQKTNVLNNERLIWLNKIAGEKGWTAETPWF